MITCKITGKRYIGQTTRAKLSYRFNDHSVYAKKHPEAKFKLPNAIRKYSIENFFIEQIEICDKDKLNEREIYWINYIDTYNTGYNSTLGGHSRNPRTILRGEDHPLFGKTGKNHPAYGFKHTEEAKQTIAEAVSNREVSDETRKKHSERMLGEKNQWFGKTFSEDHKEKQSIGLKEAYASGRKARPSKEHGARLGKSNIGRKASIEQKARQSASLKGKPKSAAHNAAVSKALTGRKLSEAHVQACRDGRARKKAERENERLRIEQAQNDYRNEAGPRNEEGQDDCSGRPCGDDVSR